MAVERKRRLGIQPRKLYVVFCKTAKIGCGVACISVAGQMVGSQGINGDHYDVAVGTGGKSRDSHR